VVASSDSRRLVWPGNLEEQRIAFDEKYFNYLAFSFFLLLDYDIWKKFGVSIILEV
jgi:hypothetical protein